MERKDLLLENAKIFIEQGRALNEVASRDVKVLVVGNPANTNAYIAMKSAPSLQPENFTAMLRLDHNRARSQLAAKAGVPVADVEKMVVWGNHSPTMYPDYRFATVGGAIAQGPDRRRGLEPRRTFIPRSAKRGAAIIEARGLSSAASAANAAIDHVRDWVLGTHGKWVTMGVPSDGSYGIPRTSCTASRSRPPTAGTPDRARPADRCVLARADEPTLEELEEERAGVAALLG